MRNLEGRIEDLEAQAQQDGTPAPVQVNPETERLHAELRRRLPGDILAKLAERRELTAEQMTRARLTAADVLGYDLEARWRAAQQAGLAR